jgi:serine/threonine-protein kinase
MNGRIGAYELRGVLGQGGMAIVYEAYQPALDRTVAIKLIHQRVEADPTFRARFEREARAAARMRHPNIVTVHDYGEQDGRPYLVMEYIDGPSLATQLRAGPLPPARAAQLIGEIAEGLDYAHQLGFLHRDVKPSNILLGGDGRQAVLSDFGLVRPMAPQRTDLTGTGVAVGTPDYMSAEQLLDEPLDGRSDLYSLGVTLYHALSGRPPFAATTPTATIAAILTQDPLTLRAVNPRVPPPLEPVVARMLARDRDQRYRTGGEFRRALEAALGMTGPTQTLPLPPPAPRPAPPALYAPYESPSRPGGPPGSGRVPQSTPYEVPPIPLPPPRRRKRLPLRIAGAAGAAVLALVCMGGIGGALLARPNDHPAAGVARADPILVAPPTAIAAATPRVAPPTATPASAGRVLLSDAFADNRNRWPVDNLHTALDPRRYRIKAAVFDGSWWAGPDLTAGDLTVEAELQRIGGTPADQYGVFFRSSLDLGYYMFAIDDNGHFYLARWVRTLSGWDDMTAGTAKVNAGGKNTLRVRVAGSKIQMEVNGAAIGEATETKPFSTLGSFGLWVNSNTQMAATRFVATTP